MLREQDQRDQAALKKGCKQICFFSILRSIS
jgi:hypothetical protein